MPEDIYRQPVDEYCAGLFGEYNLISHSAAQVAIPGIRVNGKQVMIRPEHISITTEENNGLNGTVKNILFRGSYYTADIWVDKHLIRVQTSDDQLAVGDKVSLSIAPDKIWYI